MSKSVVVTGAAGFIGSHLCDALLTQGHTVWAIDNFDNFYSRSTKEKNVAMIKNHSRLHFFEADLRDAQKTREFLQKARPQTIFHLAAKAGVRPSIVDPTAYEEFNVRVTTQLLDAAHQVECQNFLLASSSSVYGNNKKVPFSEADNVDHPISPYAATKKACELIGYTFHHLYKMNVMCLRFFTVYGPRQRPDLAIHKFAKALLAQQPIVLFGDGTTSRDYTFIEDIIDGVIRCAGYANGLHQPSYDIFNLGNSQPITLSSLVSLLEEITGERAIIDRAPMQEGDVERTYADIHHAQQTFGYQPKTDIRRGIEAFVNWLRSQ